MSRIILYVIRRDLRLSDNPILHELSKTFSQSHSPCTHLLPLYVFPAQQMEVSGFLTGEDARSPYPEARSAVAGFWRCGPQRARFMAESVFALRSSLQAVGSGLEIRAGMLGDVVANVLDGFSEQQQQQQQQQSPGNSNTTGPGTTDSNAPNSGSRVVGVWMSSAEGVEERSDQRAVQAAAESRGVRFRAFRDESYFVDDRDLPLASIRDLPNVFTSYRKMVEPLREQPRKTLPSPTKLPPLPEHIPADTLPFSVPAALDETVAALNKPLLAKPDIAGFSAWPQGAKSAHPFSGGEQEAHRRMAHLLESGAATAYKDTRNGLLGEDYSTKLSAWLALGCITARQVHSYLLDFEEGRAPPGGRGAPGYGKGESKGSGWLRFELLWRDYMMLCARKHRSKLFTEGGFQDVSRNWRYPGRKDEAAGKMVDRWLRGQTGTGLVDASMRELWLTGYTSNRARQNAASFFALGLELDWRIGAEWYEQCLVDYDVASNWGNWQNVALASRAFNPVKQAFDYDARGEYVRNWVAELRGVGDVAVVFQAWKGLAGSKRVERLEGLEMASHPLKRIEYRPPQKGKGTNHQQRRANARGGGGNR